ncbi:MAG: hypothetical protein A2Y97_10525 [Nitrospirae bacterium RBG_13_39_12]|nr:MAG: hypothetical protein A2Y97_10525 [Nitrospirae bacterium RBG_13_39_12]
MPCKKTPFFPDPDFSAYASLGNPRAPYTIFLKKDSKGKYIVVNTHRGKYDSADDVMNDIRDCLYCDPKTSN